MSSTPVPYNRQANFVTDAQGNPNITVSQVATELDAEFDAINVSLDQTQSRLGEIQRDDGALRNGIVTSDALTPNLVDQIVSDYQAYGDPTTPMTRWAAAGTGSQTVFSISGATLTNSSNYIITVDGVTQDPASYTVTADTLTFSEAPPSASAIVVICLGYQRAISVPTIGAGSVTTPLIADQAVTGAKIAPLTATGSTTARTLESRFADVINVKDFGAVGNGVTDDTAAVQAALALANSLGGRAVYIPAGMQIVIDSGDLVLGQGVSLFSDSFSPGTYEQGVQTKIILNPAYTIRVGNIGCSIKGLFIRRKGLTRASDIPTAAAIVAAMSGTAITVYNTASKANWTASYSRSGTTVTVTSTAHGLTTGSSVRVFYDTTDTGLSGDRTITVVNANTFTFTATTSGATTGTIHWEQNSLTDDVYIGHCFIAGFNQAIYLNGCGRYLIEHIYGDNVNGIWTRECYDIGRIQNCHFWPWYTTGSGIGTSRRPGIGFWIDDANDSSTITHSFSYGYDIGFKITGAGVKAVSCCTDADPRAIPVGSRGFLIANGIARNLTIGVQLINCQSCSHESSYQFDSTSTASFHTLVDCSGWSPAKNHLNITGGIVYATACNFYNTVSDAAVKVGSGAEKVRIDACSFNGVGQVFSIDAASTYKTNILTNNVFYGTCSGLSGTGTFNKIYDTSANRENIYHIGGAGPSGTNHYLAYGTPASPSAVGSAIGLGSTDYYGYDGTSFVRSGVFRYSTAGTISTGVIPAQFVLTTMDSSGVRADRVVLDPSGNLNPATDNVYSLGKSGSRWSSVWAANGTIQTSDERTKTAIEDAPLGLDFINALRPVAYKFKVGSNKVIRQVYRDAEGNEVDANAEGANPAEIITEEVAGARTHYGLLAQEVKAALPEGIDFGGWILTDKNDPNSEQGLRYEEFISPLIKAVKELSDQNQTLVNVVNGLVERIETLEAR